MTMPETSDHLYRINVDQYERLGAAGVLDGQPVELINGLLVRKMVRPKR
jgi:hypothetical protein